MNSYMKATEDNLHHGIAREMESPYLPFLGMIERSMRVSEKERFFSVAPSNESMLDYRPGQFFMVGLPGYGEAPISITSAPGTSLTRSTSSTRATACGSEARSAGVLCSTSSPARTSSLSRAA